MADDEDYPWSTDAEDCDLTYQEEAILQRLEDDSNEEGHWSSRSSVITKESLLESQKEDLRNVMELLAVKEQPARTLLIHYRWDAGRIFESLDQKGPDRLFSEAGVLTLLDNKGLSTSANPLTCNVCFETIPADAIFEMNCGHSFCNDCWTEHFIAKINDGQSRRIRCMASECSAVCDEAIVRNLVSARCPDVADRFDRSLFESYIEDNDKVKWCPSVPHCGNAVRVDGDVYCEVECACGLQFCFNCSSEAHSPCSCPMWELWIKKFRDGSETVNWITLNTTPCPKCHKPVEKNGGCNLVKCICGQQFCWSCGRATCRGRTWSTISGQSCARFEGGQMKKTERDLYRYRQYYRRYKMHADSLKQESKLLETIQKKISISEKKHSIIRDYSWLTDGVNRLFRSRRVLTYSYPFAFCMFGDEIFKNEMRAEERELKKNLFEDQQQQLESNVKKLSILLEKDFTSFPDDEVTRMMLHIENLSRIVDKLCKQMYQCIENDLCSLERESHCIAPYKPYF